MAVERHTITVGDTLTPMGHQLKQPDADGVLTVVNLTGMTVKFMMVDSSGKTKTAETTTGVTVTDATNGKVQYDFQAADVNTAGVFYCWFRVYSGTEFDTYPAGGRKLMVVIKAAA